MLLCGDLLSGPQIRELRKVKTIKPEIVPLFRRSTEILTRLERWQVSLRDAALESIGFKANFGPKGRAA